MTNEARTIRDRVDATVARELEPAPPNNPALEANARELEAQLTSSWNDAFGADALIDRALKDVRRRAQEVEAVVEDVAVARRDVVAGRADAGKVETEVRDTLAREEKATEVAIAAARKAVEVGRERIVRELLPEPARGTTSAEAKADLQLIVAGFEDAADGYRHAVRQAVQADDRVALGLLAGSFGQALYRARGGDPDTYAALRQELVTAVAEEATRRSPRSTEARRWHVALADPATRYVTGEGLRSTFRLKDIPR